MRKEKLKELIQNITEVLLKAGELSVISQGRVVNIGKKDREVKELGPERIKERGRAKTEIDEKVQEMILMCIENIFGTDVIKIDAEEDTPSKKLFTNQRAQVTIIIDPIDGTLEYVQGFDKYSINVGLVENGLLISAFIYFPAKKQLYYLDENKKPYITIYYDHLQLKNNKEIIPPEHSSSRTLYTNNRVPTDMIHRLGKNNFTVIQDDGIVLWPDALLKCISGEYLASIFHSPQSWDVLLGGFVDNLPGGYMVDWEGKKLKWSSGGRIPRVIFGFGKLPDEIVKSLRE